ncbi:MAG: hypothetical protein AB7U05_03695 [Mangrovibacterium sp.]
MSTNVIGALHLSPMLCHINLQILPVRCTYLIPDLQTTNVSVRCTCCLYCGIHSTNIFGALHLAFMFCAYNSVIIKQQRCGIFVATDVAQTKVQRTETGNVKKKSK